MSAPERQASARWEHTPARALGSAQGRLRSVLTMLAADRRKLANATNKGFRTRLERQIAKHVVEAETLELKIKDLESRMH